MSIEKFEAIKKNASEIVKIKKKASKLSAVDYQDVTQKRYENIQADLAWLAMEREKLEHELHCLCVEVGVAGRDDWRYGEREFNPSAFHKYRVKMREPNL